MANHGHRFNIQTPRDFLHDLVIPQYEDFTRNNGSVRHALLTIILVSHMYEWVHGKGSTSLVERFRSNYPNEDNDMAIFFDVARKIANDAKHFVTNVETIVQPGFSRAFNDAFTRPLNIRVSKDHIVSVDRFLDNLVDFWKRQENLGFKQDS